PHGAHNPTSGSKGPPPGGSEREPQLGGLAVAVGVPAPVMVRQPDEATAAPTSAQFEHYPDKRFGQATGTFPEPAPLFASHGLLLPSGGKSITKSSFGGDT